MSKTGASQFLQIQQGRNDAVPGSARQKREVVYVHRSEKSSDKNDMEIKLAKKAVRGDADAYGELIRQNQEYLYKMAYLYTENQQDALDVAGTAILKGYQHIRSLKNPQWFRTWLTRILIRCAQDANKKIVYFDSIDEVEIPERYEGISLEETWDLRNAIELLPEKYRNVIILKYFSEMSVQEIAYVLEIPSGSVKAYLSRGRDELKKYLGGGLYNAESV